MWKLQALHSEPSPSIGPGLKIGSPADEQLNNGHILGDVGYRIPIPVSLVDLRTHCEKDIDDFTSRLREAQLYRSVHRSIALIMSNRAVRTKDVDEMQAGPKIGKTRCHQHKERGLTVDLLAPVNACLALLGKGLCGGLGPTGVPGPTRVAATHIFPAG
ncbi:hypothetical protein VTG60DRAFT_669 [Thermothelomyces hinnuleus]